MNKMTKQDYIDFLVGRGLSEESAEWFASAHTDLKTLGEALNEEEEERIRQEDLRRERDKEVRELIDAVAFYPRPRHHKP